jgi:putative methionine-R-sulfoxide reductase with GAF domain
MMIQTNNDVKINNFLDLVTNVMEAYTAALFNVEAEKEGTLKLFSYRSFSKNIDADCRLLSGEGFVSWVQREQKSVLVNNFDRSTTTLKFYSQDEDIKSLLAVPLPEQEGVLYVDSKKSYRFTEEREKICRQMAFTALALIRARKEGEEKRIMERMLSFSGEMDELLLREQTREELLKEALEIISRWLVLEFAFFVVPEEVVHYCQQAVMKGNYIHRTNPPGSFSEDGLLGWAIRNGKKVVREKIVPKAKSFILNREESLGPFANFVGVPLWLPGSRKKGGVGLIKPAAEKWSKLEIETAGHVVQRFFRQWSAKGK